MYIRNNILGHFKPKCILICMMMEIVTKEVVFCQQFIKKISATSQAEQMQQ